MNAEGIAQFLRERLEQMARNQAAEDERHNPCRVCGDGGGIRLSLTRENPRRAICDECVAYAKANNVGLIL